MINSRWITLGSLETMMPLKAPKLNGSILFRKEFMISEKVRYAKLSICALGLGVYSINGKAVTEDVLCTPFTHYDKRVIYQVYDVTDLLRTGKNVIGVHAGNGFYNDNRILWNDAFAPWRDNPKLAVMLEIELESGKKEVLRTDTSWKCVSGPSVYNHMRQGEIFDASLQRKGFDIPGYDDADWENAKITHEPGGVLETVDMPPIRVVRTIEPISCKAGIYDFGENISGWAKITAIGEKGQKIRLIHDEALKNDTELRESCKSSLTFENISVCFEDIYIMSGEGEEEFRPSFCYHGFRYVKVENAPESFSIVAEVVHTDLKRIGSFYSDNDMLNKIHEASVRSTLSNYVGIPTDCPHREQNGWTGDAWWSADQSLMNFDMERAYAKWLRDFKDAQRPNGQLPGIIPSAGWGFNWGSGPGWDSALILIPWKVYVHTGNTSIMEDMWENMVLYMEYFERMSDQYIACFGLGDWAPVRKPVCPTEIVDTAYFYVDALTMAKIAKVLGKDSSYWYDKAEQIRTAWRNAFWNKSDHEELKTFQTFWACAIYYGLLEQEEIPYAAECLAKLVQENDYHIDCGTAGTKCIFNALSDNGYVDVIYKMVTNPEAPSYAYWINNGATTFCEYWNMKESRNHHMYSEVDNWLYRYVGGIQINEEGLIIKPHILNEVNYVCAEYNGTKVERRGNKVDIICAVDAKVIIGTKDYCIRQGESVSFLM